MTSAKRQRAQANLTLHGWVPLDFAWLADAEYGLNLHGVFGAWATDGSEIMVVCKPGSRKTYCVEDVSCQPETTVICEWDRFSTANFWAIYKKICESGWVVEL